MIPACPSLVCFFLTRAILKGLALGKPVWCLWMIIIIIIFCSCVWMEFADLTWQRICIYEKTFEMCCCFWQSLIVLRWVILTGHWNPVTNLLTYSAEIGMVCVAWEIWLLLSLQLRLHRSWFPWQPAPDMPSKATLFNLKCEPVFDFGTGPRNHCYYNPQGNNILVYVLFVCSIWPGLHCLQLSPQPCLVLNP